MHNLVLIHGATGTPADFEPLSSLLAPFCRLYPYTMMGHAGRPLPAEHTVDALLDDVRRFMDRWDLAKASVFGYSSGATYAFLLAHRRPELVTSVIAVAGYYILEPLVITDQSEANYIARLDRYTAPLKARHLPVDWRDQARSLLEWARTMAGPDGWRPEHYREVKQPALVINGQADSSAPFETAQQVAKMLPRHRFRHFPGTGHPMWKAPVSTVAQEIRTFLDTVHPAGREAAGDGV